MRLGYQADDELHYNLRSAGVKNLFFLCRNLSVEFILLITFRTSDSSVESQVVFICSKSTMKAGEQCVKHVQR